MAFPLSERRILWYTVRRERDAHGNKNFSHSKTAHGNRHDPGQHLYASAPVHAAPAGREHLPAAVQHGGYLGGGELCKQRGFLRRGLRRTHYLYPYRLFHGPEQRRRGDHGPVFRRRQARKRSKDRSHRHSHDADPGRAVYRHRDRIYPHHAGLYADPGRSPARGRQLPDHLFCRGLRPDAV